MPQNRSMSPEQIELRVERMMDYLDRLYLAGEMTEDNYNKEVRDLDRWAEYQYRVGKSRKAKNMTLIWGIIILIALSAAMGICLGIIGDV